MTISMAAAELPSPSVPVDGTAIHRRSAQKRALRNAIAPAACALLLGGAAYAQQGNQAAQPNTDPNATQAAQPNQPNSLDVPQGDNPAFFVGTTAQDVGVMERLRPEYDAKGIPLGGFRLYPTLTASVNFDDNVRRVQLAESDFYFEQAPALHLQSQWGRHFVEVYAGLDNFAYADQDALSLTDWNIGAAGRYDISRAMTLNAAGSYGEYHEGLESPNTETGQLSPTRYFKTHGEFIANYRPNALGLSAAVSVDRFKWGMTRLINGTSFSNADRDETELQAYVKASYDFSPGYSGFIKALYDGRDFDLPFDRAGLHRASSGYRINGGVDLQLTHLISGEVFLGYLEQHYSKNVPIPLPSVSGLDYGVALDWYVDPVLTLHLTGSRQVSDITIYQASATDDKIVKLSADYEFLRNFIVQGYVSWRDSSFIGLTRRDEYPGAGIKGRYLIDTHASLELGYNYSGRNTNTLQLYSFDDNIVTLALKLHI